MQARTTNADDFCHYLTPGQFISLLMQKPPEASVTEHVPLALRWQRLRAAYRMANLATHHVLGFTIKLVLLAYFAFAVLFLFLRYAILPNIDYYKGDIERAASRALAATVRPARSRVSASAGRRSMACCKAWPLLTASTSGPSAASRRSMADGEKATGSRR